MAKRTLLWTTLLALLVACNRTPRDKLLAGKACSTRGECAAGYVCQKSTNLCVVAGSATGGGNGAGGGSGGTTPDAGPDGAGPRVPVEAGSDGMAVDAGSCDPVARCSGECRDLGSDESHCGACGAVCTAPA